MVYVCTKLSIKQYFSQDLHWLLILLFLAGKMGITASFTIVYVHTAEMLPTVSHSQSNHKPNNIQINDRISNSIQIIRSGGVGTMSTVARIGVNFKF